MMMYVDPLQTVYVYSVLEGCTRDVYIFEITGSKE